MPTKGRSTLKQALIKSAHINGALDEWLSSASLSEIYLYRSLLYTGTYWWLQDVSETNVNQFFDELPWLDLFLSRPVVLQRLNNKESLLVELNKGEQKGVIKLFGLSISNLIPEIREIQVSIGKFLDQSKASYKDKSEAWLYSVSMNTNTHADYEAAVYLKSRNLPTISAGDIEADWYSSICFDVSRKGGSYGKKPDVETIAAAEARTITLKAAAEALVGFGGVIPFRTFRDEEEDFVDATLLRTADFFQIGGYDAWWKAATSSLSSGPVDGIEFILSSFRFFFWCRSDLALRLAKKQGLDAWIWALHNADGLEGKPWESYNRNSDRTKELRLSDHINTAASLAFCSRRVNPDSPNTELVEQALSLLMQSQLRSGAWPNWSDESEGSLLPTCFAIHALAVCRPKNWQSIAKRGAAWLIEEHEKSGGWFIGGGPTVMLAVLAHDAIALAEGETKVTFSFTEPTSHTTTVSKETVESPKPSTSGLTVDTRMPIVKTFATVPYEELGDNKSADIVIMTATTIELQQVLKLLEPREFQSEIIRTPFEQGTYYIGKFGAFNAVVTKSTMGDTGPSGSTLATAASLTAWKPYALIVIGIAFGANPKKQRIGDVLVAADIMPYDVQKIGDAVQYRAPIPPAGDTLLNRFEHAFNWQFKGPNNKNVGVHLGRLLSGSVLINNPAFKAALLADHPTAIGGEMEGAGIWAAAQRNKTEWIVVKSICDWADGKKNDKFQALAAASAASLCHYVLSDPHALHGLKK